MPTIFLIGTLDTKGEECAYVRHRIEERGNRFLTTDAGVLTDAGKTAEIPALDLHINNSAFADAIADTPLEQLTSTR